jgi:hypothetical protein
MNGTAHRRPTARRPAAYLLAVATAVALGVTAMTAVPALASGPTISVSPRTLLGAPGKPRFKPKTISLSGGGSTYVITGIRWRGWNRARAVGTGTTTINGQPSVATLIASSRAYCSTIGAYLYDKLQSTL